MHPGFSEGDGVREFSPFGTHRTGYIIASPSSPVPMTPDERDEMNRICRLIQDEKEPVKFASLVQQLIELLERKEQRLEPTKRGI